MHTRVTDVDECSSRVDPCGVTSVCRNTEGGFECVCKYGYREVVGDDMTVSCTGTLLDTHVTDFSMT